jgi:1-acyl-sn-glycerol-3-phosphate acyltransferase
MSEKKFQQKVIAGALAGLSRLITGAQARWLCEPTPRQRIYFANHTSHLDTLVLWAALPGNIQALTRPVAARDYWESSALRRFFATEVFNAVLVDRAVVSREAILQSMSSMIGAMGDHFSLIIFPEGTRGDGITIQPFKSGLHHLAKAKPEAELVPVYLENLNRILPKGEFLPAPLMSSITFGPVLNFDPAESKSSFLARARQTIIDLEHL